MTDTPPKRRPGGRPFQKGQSGNPGGMPKGYGEVKELARTYTKTAIEALVRQATEGPPAAQVAAAIALLDRGWGKPSQPVGGADDLPPIRATRELSDEELQRIVAEAASVDRG